MSTIFKSLALLVLSGCLTPLSAMVVSVEPGSIKNNRQADMNLSGLIVRKVQWEDGALMMPVTVSNDRSYFDVKLISRELYLKMEDCFVNGCRESTPADRPTLPVVKVEAIKKLNSKFRVSNIEISFDSSITVSVGIMAENYPDGTYWLSYPQSIDFASPLLKEQTDNVVFGAYAAENPHLNIVRSSGNESSRSHYSKNNPGEKAPEVSSSENEAPVSVVRKPVYEDDDSSRKSKKGRTKGKKRKQKKKNSSSSQQEEQGSASWHNSNPMYEEFEE